MPRKESDIFSEIDEWKILTSMPEWHVYVQLMNKHCIYLQKEVNRCVRDGDTNGAIAFLARKDEIPKVLGLVTDRIETLREEGDKDGADSR